MVVYSELGDIGQIPIITGVNGSTRHLWNFNNVLLMVTIFDPLPVSFLIVKRAGLGDLYKVPASIISTEVPVEGVSFQV
jgi:hypothetical protein